MRPVTAPRPDGTSSEHAEVERALGDLRAGRPVVVLDANDRENEADLIAPADAMTRELSAFFVRHTSGVICAAMTPERLAALGIPLMVADNTESHRTAFTVTVDAAEGITTGISAADRTRTLRLLADAASRPADFVRPGHIFPLRARALGVLERPGHTEAAVDLCRMAGRAPVGALAELVSDDGPVLRSDAAREFASRHDLVVLRIADLIAYRRRHEQLMERVATARLPMAGGSMTVHGYRSAVDGIEHVALVVGDVRSEPAGRGDQGDQIDQAGPLVRVHSECLTGDVLGSRRCDCGPQLDSAVSAIARAGRGVIVYLRGHEGRGIGLLQKLEAYTLQDAGRDTVDANLALGFPADARDYWPAAQILRDLGVDGIRLLTNNPAKQAGLEAYGIKVRDREPLLVEPTADNHHYLATKQARLGHLLPEQMFSAGEYPTVRPERLRRQ